MTAAVSQSTIIADVAMNPNVEVGAEQAAEEIQAQGEMPAGEMGSVPGGKSHVVTKEPGLTLKFSDLLPEGPKLNHIKQFDSKKFETPLRFQEKTLGKQESKAEGLKQTKTQTSEKSEITRNASALNAKGELKGEPAKAQFVAKQTLPLLFPKESAKRAHHSTAEKTTTRAKEKSREAAKSLNSRSQQVREKEEAEQRRVERKKDEEKEGSAQDQHQQQNEEEKEGHSGSKIAKTAATPKNVLEYGTQESTLLSEVFNMRISQFDVLLLFFEILKLAINDREQQQISRREERLLQLEYIEKTVEDYKKQGNYLLFAGIGAGVLGIASGLCPVIGHMKGEWFRDQLGSVFKGMQDMDHQKLVTTATKMTEHGSKMMEMTGHVQKTLVDGDCFYDQQMSDIHRNDREDNTRTMDEIRDEWRNIEQFLHQLMQMEHDAARQLYS